MPDTGSSSLKPSHRNTLNNSRRRNGLKKAQNAQTKEVGLVFATSASFCGQLSGLRWTLYGTDSAENGLGFETIGGNGCVRNVISSF